MRGSGSGGSGRRVLFVALLVVALTLTSAGVTTVVAGASTKRVLPNSRHYPKRVERWRKFVAKYFPKKHGVVPMRLQQQALAIIWVESGGRNKAGNCDGIWQLAKCHGTRKQRLDPAWATRLAARMYRGRHRRWAPAWRVARSLGLK